jgi:iron complex transport system substrate-binding protein
VANEPGLAGTRVVALNPQSLEDILADLLRLGDATGRREAAEACVAGLRERLSAVAIRVPPHSLPRVACIEWIEPLMLAGNWVPELISRAGGISLLTEPGRHSPYVRWEEVLAADPEVILVAPCGFDLARTFVEAEALGRVPQWRELSAVRAGRVFALDGNAYFNRSGPRVVNTVEILAGVLHPGLFPAPDDRVCRRLRTPS